MIHETTFNATLLRERHIKHDTIFNATLLATFEPRLQLDESQIWRTLSTRHISVLRDVFWDKSKRKGVLHTLTPTKFGQLCLQVLKAIQKPATCWRSRMMRQKSPCTPCYSIVNLHLLTMVTGDNF